METGTPTSKPGSEDTRCRYRILFHKTGPLIYTSHLDVARIWERVLRRANVPLMYSQGFNPRPQLQLAAALPLGFSSSCELLDIFLREKSASPQQMLEIINSKCPQGLFAESIVEVSYKSPALQTLTRSATYKVCLDDVSDVGDLQAKLAGLLEQSEIIRVRRGKEYNLRPLIYHAELLDNHSVCLKLQLALSQQLGTGRPDEVISELGIDPSHARVSRVEIIRDAV